MQETMISQVRIIWDCPTCDWFRVRNDDREWDNRIIEHPVYGPIRNIDLYKKDIREHDCEETRQARLRIKHYDKLASKTRRLMIERRENDTPVVRNRKPRP